jgi:hypothetical protein
MSTEPFLDPAESCPDNLEFGPLGLFAGTISASQNDQPQPSFAIKGQAHEL